uniref:RING-type domain-containing protein n=1 Tax=Chlamydomonas leiostraca TaxID=1034604 RepID=A0A7S0RTK4_9CHLO|mmetsp:Transcript_31293/g.79796  ORF Transcript_31293/g.79796 Transcript_31293/m.79796 type:complete len:459 (+) Transcript_31293:213-1589(+)|eukprot:CAMPEP_0202857684 /NCGR_PEP_ID=MMETSP1391-20130828/527_1 /ASSEMBLY_ACC=CAM_ASM_000867 /TAXON_ID=1034604 /ORGANISM="Chlamydomonas leiostraca, Strain SAG 11-49" /LENGTH=458 /DNA_ID=CAMNT_0049536519 /DNA_START=195 /DNA_END=1571 /DNA_ORIENTATION=-
MVSRSSSEEAPSRDDTPAIAVQYNSELGRPSHHHHHHGQHHAHAAPAVPAGRGRKAQQREESPDSSTSDSATQEMHKEQEDTGAAAPCSKRQKPASKGAKASVPDAAPPACSKGKGHKADKSSSDEAWTDPLGPLLQVEDAHNARGHAAVVSPAAAAAAAVHKRPRDAPVPRMSDDGMTNRAGGRRSSNGAPEQVHHRSSAGRSHKRAHAMTPPPRPPGSPVIPEHTHVRGMHEAGAVAHAAGGRGHAYSGGAAGRGAGSALGGGPKAGRGGAGSHHHDPGSPSPSGEHREGSVVSEEGSQGPHGDEAGTTHHYGAQPAPWWAPQPVPPADASTTTHRPAWALARALACCACGDLLKEAITSTECGHSFCYDCIAARAVIGGKHNVCPVKGCDVVLGPDPWEHGKLRYDGALDGLVARVFPRPRLDAALAARRAEREQGTREVKAALAAAPRRLASIE